MNNEKIINEQENESTSLCLDIRNSSKIISQFSSIDQLKFHADFMMEIKQLVFQDPAKGGYTANDTGDGMICLFWNKTHAWSALRIGVAIHDLLRRFLARKYNKFLQSQNINEQFGFGIGIHCASSLIYRNNDLKQDFMFGKVLNTTSRLESFTKSYREINILFTEDFVKTLKTQLDDFNKSSTRKRKLTKTELNNCLRRISKDKVDINDGRDTGHTIWTINQPHDLLLCR